MSKTRQKIAGAILSKAKKLRQEADRLERLASEVSELTGIELGDSMRLRILGSPGKSLSYGDARERAYRLSR